MSVPESVSFHRRGLVDMPPNLKATSFPGQSRRTPSQRRARNIAPRCVDPERSPPGLFGRNPPTSVEFGSKLAMPKPARLRQNLSPQAIWYRAHTRCRRKYGRRTPPPKEQRRGARATPPGKTPRRRLHAARRAQHESGRKWPKSNKLATKATSTPPPNLSGMAAAHASMLGGASRTQQCFGCQRALPFFFV